MAIEVAVTNAVPGLFCDKEKTRTAPLRGVLIDLDSGLYLWKSEEYSTYEEALAAAQDALKEIFGE